MALGWLWGGLGWLWVALPGPGLDGFSPLRAFGGSVFCHLPSAFLCQGALLKTRAFLARFLVYTAKPGGWLTCQCAASARRASEAFRRLARWACPVRDDGPKTETKMLLAQPTGSCQTSSWMSHQPDNIFAGTQVVAHVEIRGPNKSLVNLRVAVGVIARTTAGDDPEATGEMNSVPHLSTTDHQIGQGQRSDHRSQDHLA